MSDHNLVIIDTSLEYKDMDTIYICVKFAFFCSWELFNRYVFIRKRITYA